MIESNGFPKFVDNAADGKDKFPEKAQEKVAKAISELISKKEPKSKIIGLEGDWGSGKSNVIKIIQSNLLNTHHVYIHDIWSYQEDLQRRAFLESLTANLCESNKPFIEKPEKWKARLKDLLTKTKETTTDIIPRFSPGILFVLSCVFLWSILGDFAGPITLAWGGEIHPRFWVIVIALIGYAIFSIKAKRLLLPKDVFYLYNEKDTQKVTNETIYEDEPSLEKFEEWIIDLQKDFPIGKELIVVFDNMDRLPKEKVRQIWSLIHTFFSESNFDKIWMIVPYSRDHIKCAFENGSFAETDHFIDKTFTIQYQVPPPILSDWKVFFTKIYCEAFGENEDDELSIILGAFDRLTEKITPRRIIVFINEMVAMKKMWRDVEEIIPLRYIAVYCLTKREILKNPAEQILSKQFLGKSEPLFREDKYLQDNISALSFNIPVKSAAQVVLKQELKNYLRGNAFSQIDNYAKLPFFIDLLSAILLEENITTGFELVINKISQDIYEKLDKNKINEIWNTLLTNRMRLAVVVQEFSESDKVLLNRIESNKKQSFVNKIISELSSTNINVFKGSLYFETIKKIEDYLTNNELNNISTTNSNTSYVKPEEFLSYLTLAREDYKKYGLAANNDELNGFLLDLQLGSFNGYPNIDFKSIIYLKNDTEYNLSKYLEYLKLRLSSDAIGELTTDNFELLIAIYKAFNSERPILPLIPENKIEALLDSMESLNLNLPNLISIHIQQKKANPDNSSNRAYQNLETEELPELVSHCVLDYIYLADLIDLVFYAPNPFLKTIIKKLLTTKIENIRAIDTNYVLQFFTEIRDFIPLSHQELINWLNQFIDVEIKNINENNIKNVIPSHSTFGIIIKENNPLSDYLKSKMKDYLKAISEENWKIHLQNNESYEFIILSYLLNDIDGIKTLPDNIMNAYLTSLEDIARNKYTVPDQDEQQWLKFAKTTDKAKLTATLRGIRDIFLSPNNPEININQFKTFTPIFKDFNILQEYYDGVCRRILKPVIEDESILKIVLMDQDYYSFIINHGGDDSYILKQKIITISQNKPEDTELSKFVESIS